MEGRTLTGAALLGMAAGMRVTAPLLALGMVLSHRRRIGAPLCLWSAGELVYDKLPQAAQRTDPKLLAARIVSGALAGSLVTRAAKGPAVLGAVIGALASTASAFLFHRLRVEACRTMPAFAVAISEDVLAFYTSIATVRALL
jgi:uncharacterized membrane protein